MDALEIMNILLPQQSKLAIEYHRLEKERKREKRMQNKARRESEKLTSLNRYLEL